MTERGYGQFCPVAMATEVLGARWNILIIRELLCGSSRFNELRKGVPRMSPALLSKRLGELERCGVIVREVDEAGGSPVYQLTEAGEELRDIVMSMGVWGQRWLESQLSLKNLDPSLLMWDMRRNLDPDPLPDHRVTIQFLYPELTHGQKTWWLVVDKHASEPVDLCKMDPGYEVDLHVITDLKTMTAIWMGIITVEEATRRGTLRLSGSRELSACMSSWMGLSPFARESKQVREVV